MFSLAWAIFPSRYGLYSGIIRQLFSNRKKRKSYLYHMQTRKHTNTERKGKSSASKNFIRFFSQHFCCCCCWFQQFLCEYLLARLVWIVKCWTHKKSLLKVNSAPVRCWREKARERKPKSQIYTLQIEYFIELWMRVFFSVFPMQTTLIRSLVFCCCLSVVYNLPHPNCI